MATEGSDEDIEIDSDILKQAKQLLALADLVERYPNAVARRITGLIYVLIGGGVSFITLLYTGMHGVLESLAGNILFNTIFVLLTLLLTWVITFKIILPIAKSYPEPESSDERSEFKVKVIWGLLGASMIITSLFTFGIGHPELFPICIQLIISLGNIGNYFIAQDDLNPDLGSSKVHLYFAVILFLSIIPIVLFPAMMFNIMIIVDMGGIYVIGIYMLITAETVLLDISGRE